MKYIIRSLCLLLSWLMAQQALAQGQINVACQNLSSQEFYTGDVFFNLGSTSDAFNSSRRINITVGQAVVGEAVNQARIGSFGFWSRLLIAPAPPAVMATEGDLPDRINIFWEPDPLSPVVSGGFNIYRDGVLLTTVDPDIRSFVDFNVIAGQFYTYSVSGKNQFGEGSRGSALGFLNPNGVVTGQVKSNSSNPVPGVIVTLSPTIGASARFDGNGKIFAEYSPVFPTSQFTISCWVKIDDNNNSTAIYDFGSHIGKNWWLHTLPSSSGKGVRFSMAKSGGGTTSLQYAFPAATADDWHNVAVSFSGTSVLLYVDGELIETAVTGFQQVIPSCFSDRKPMVPAVSRAELMNCAFTIASFHKRRYRCS